MENNIAQNLLGEPKESLLHNPALRGQWRGTHCSSPWKCWQLPVVTSWNTLGWPGSPSRLVTATVGSSGLISPLSIPVLFIFFPGMLTGRSTHTQISSKIKSGINYLSTYPSWWLYGFASLHPHGRVLALLLQTHLIMRRAVSIKCPPFVFALFAVLDSKEPLALLPKWLSVTTAL